jgi:hypothetical protein
MKTSFTYQALLYLLISALATAQSNQKSSYIKGQDTKNIFRIQAYDGNTPRVSENLPYRMFDENILHPYAINQHTKAGIM